VKAQVVQAVLRVLVLITALVELEVLVVQQEALVPVTMVEQGVFTVAVLAVAAALVVVHHKVLSE
jgi:hypothetical protein